VPGYYPTPSYQSPLSVVAYRVNGQNKVERLGKGLVWNAVSSSFTPIAFIPIALASPLPIQELPAPTPAPPTPAPAWPQAGNSASDPDYEIVGPQVFRFEYCYLLRGGTDPTGGITYSAILTDTPWDARITGHTSPNGMQDIAAIVVDIAVIDPKSKGLVTDAQLTALAGNLIDWGTTGCPNCPTQPQWQATQGLLRTQWQNTLNTIIANQPAPTPAPRPALSGIRLYERYFYLSPPISP